MMNENITYNYRAYIGKSQGLANVNFPGTGRQCSEKPVNTLFLVLPETREPPPALDEGASITECLAKGKGFDDNIGETVSAAIYHL